MLSVFSQLSVTQLPLIFLPSPRRVKVDQEQPLALRQLLWLEDKLFVGVCSGLLPTSSTLLMLHSAQDTDDTLVVRSAKQQLRFWIPFSWIIWLQCFKSELSPVFPCFRSEIEVDGVVVSMVHCFQSGTVALQLEDGQIRKLLWGQLQTLFFCYWIVSFAKWCFVWILLIVVALFDFKSTQHNTEIVQRLLTYSLPSRR